MKYLFIGSHTIYDDDGNVIKCQDWFLAHKNGNFSQSEAIKFIEDNKNTKNTVVFCFDRENLPDLLKSISKNFLDSLGE